MHIIRMSRKVAGGAVAAAVVMAGLATPAYASVPKPVVQALSATYGPAAGGARISVFGVNFRHVTEVAFGATPAGRIRVLSARRIQVTVPAHPAGTVNVWVYTAHGRSRGVLADQYTYVTTPTVSRVLPPSGSFLGGQRITVIGSNFYRVSAVTFGGVRGTSIRVQSPHQLQVTVPAALHGPVVDVRVRTSYGISKKTKADRFTYVVPTVGDTLPAELVDQSTGHVVGAEVTLDGLNDNATPTSIAAPAGDRYVSATFTVTATTQAVEGNVARDVAAADIDGNTYSPVDVPLLGCSGFSSSGVDGQFSVPAGQQLTGCVTFDVPKTESLFLAAFGEDVAAQVPSVSGLSVAVWELP